MPKLKGNASYAKRKGKVLFELRPHQKKALSRLKSGKILWGGVGSGKSLVAVAYYAQEYSTRNVYVITTAKKRDSLDWNREFARFGVGPSPDATVAGVLQVDSWNNIHKYTTVRNAFFVFDEQRLVGSGGWVKAFLHIARQNDWILLSATPGDNWLDYVPCFIANGFYKNRTEFKARHVVYKAYTKFPVVERYLETGRLIRLRQQILVHMPYERLTTRHTIFIPVPHDVEAMDMVMKKRWNPWKQKPIRNGAERYALMRKVVNTHPSRLQVLRKKMIEHPRLIVFYNFDYELEILRSIEDVPRAEWNSHKHEEIPQTDKWVYFVQFTAGAEAWECTETNATFFWSQNPSYKVTEQAYGRMDRLNTPFGNLFYYLPMSDAWIDKAMRRAFEEKKDFNMSVFHDQLSLPSFFTKKTS
jgi:hypothetical protein